VNPTKTEKDIIDRWNRNEGEIKVPNKGGAPKGHLNTLKHGIFADRCLTPEEKATFNIIIEKLHDDFQFNKSSDYIQVELVGIYSVKLVRAQMDGNTQAAESLDRMIRAHMKDLKTTKIAREGVEAQRDKTSPAEWASNLLEKAGETPKKKTTTRKKTEKSSDNTKSSKKQTAKN